MAYETICGFLPYDVEFLSLQELSEVINHERPRPMEAPYKEKIPSRVERIIMRGLNANPAARPSAAEFSKIMNDFSPEQRSRNISRLTAVAVVSLIAAGIVYHLLDSPEAELENKVAVPYVKPVPGVKTIHVKKTDKPETPQPGVKAVQKPFYKDSAPESIKSEWKELKNELATDPEFKGHGGALLFPAG